MPRLGMRIRPSGPPRRRPGDTPLVKYDRPCAPVNFWEAVAEAVSEMCDDPEMAGLRGDVVCDAIVEMTETITSTIRGARSCDCGACDKVIGAGLVGLVAFCAHVASEMRLFPEGPSLPPAAIHNPPGSDPDGC